MKYTITPATPHQRYIAITAEIEDIRDEIVEIQLPAWRPGRYELGNFAKNVRSFKVTGESGVELPCIKITKDLWQVQALGNKRIKVSYEYFAATLDAGSTYTDEELLYVNPVNCLVYEITRLDEPCHLTLKVPENFRIACALKKEGNTLLAKNFDELADSPLMASPHLEHYSFEFSGATHHIWINGKHTLDTENFIEGVRAYTATQVGVFDHFPANDFHYLIHFLPNNFRHGVEHCFSTVIAIGPGEEFHNTEKKDDLLAICSHELFHFWNVKRLRPASMLPYNFTGENYSALGYIYEGITTYYGDFMLLRSQVWDFATYSNHFSSDIQRHFSNSGRYNYSVAESSFDTWLDGYLPGAPGRKVSIYVEGMLAALILDVYVRKYTEGKSTLDTLLKAMYDRFYLQDKGYTEQDYKDVLEEITGMEMDGYFEDIIWGRGKIEKYLPETLAELGLEIQESPSPVHYESVFGFKTAHAENSLTIVAVSEGSPADNAGLALGDKVISVNGETVTNETELEAAINNSNGIEVEMRSMFSDKKLKLEQNGARYFNRYKVVKSENPTHHQKEFYKAWSNQEF